MNRTVYLDRAVKASGSTERILSGLAAHDVREVDHIDDIVRASDRPFRHVSYWRQKIFVTRQKGNFLKPFYHHPSLKQPEKKTYLISHMEGCFRDCLYCYLQAYQNPPLVKLFTNLADIPARIDALLEKERGARLFFAAGILSDSLDLDRVTGLSAILFPYFNGKAGPVLEMRTKSSAVGHLPPGRGPGGRILLSWTLSTPGVHRMLETGTASPESRIRAAAAAQKKGYPVAFHMDPIFYYPGWETAYQRLIDGMRGLIDTDSLSHITLGGFRYGEALKRIIEARASSRRLFLGEFVRCADGKFRYFAPIRIHFYRRISRMIRAAFPGIPVTLNMETPAVWRQWRRGDA